MKRLQLIFKYFRYRLTAKTKHDIHSPFVFDLLTNIIEDLTPFYIYKEIELIRTQLLAAETSINITDFGAGSSVNKSKTRQIKDIAKHTVKPVKYSQLLFRLVHHFKPQSILELGTSLGISTAYLAAPDSDAQVYTMEGCPETAKIARKNFERLKLENINLITGNFDETLPELLSKLNQLDMVFFDGNHRKVPTLNYFEQCLPLANNDSLFIFDDIHWSGEMEEAWESIKKHPGVTVTIDLFFIGLVFFRKELSKQDFVIKF